MMNDRLVDGQDVLGSKVAGGTTLLQSVYAVEMPMTMLVCPQW